MCKYNNKKYFLFGTMIVFIICMFLFSSNVFASDVKSYTTVSTGSVQTVKGICSNANNSVGGVDILSCDNNGRLSFNTVKYLSLSADDKETFMTQALTVTRGSGLGVKTKNQVYNFIAQQDTSVSAAIKYLAEDTSADFATASKWIRPFSGGIGVVTGVLCLVIFLFLGISIVIDIAYLVLPGVQLILERGEERKRPIGVSNEAWKVNREVAKDMNNSENVLIVYLKRRVPVIFIIAIALGYLISGKVYDIFTYIANSFNV